MNYISIDKEIHRRLFQRIEYETPFYSTNIAAAWKIIEKLTKMGYFINISSIWGHGYPFYAVEILWDKGKISVTEETPALAVSIATVHLMRYLKFKWRESIGIYTYLDEKYLTLYP